MVTTKETLLYGTKVSTVGPGMMTGQDVVHEPTNLDLAMKLHYLRGVYYFKAQAVHGLTTMDIKDPIFKWFNHYYATCGRLRRADSGRPYIKCNDCGTRFIESQCDKTLEEWLEMKDEALEKLLVPNQVVGPELQFSPLVFLQLTRFGCGGVSVGVSWAHVLGDAFSAVYFMNAWSQAWAQKPAQLLKPPQTHTKPKTSPSPPTPFNDPLSVKRVGPVGDHWLYPNSSKMETFSFNLTTKQITQLQSKVSGPIGTNQIPLFESLCAIIWKVIAQTRNGPEPKVVTVCKNDPNGRRKNGILGTNQIISMVKAEFPVTEAHLKELAELVKNRAVDERDQIEEAVERDTGLPDFIVYGANLTFVDLQGADLYGLEFNGHKPVYVGYTADGVGEEGLVLVLPGPEGEKIVTLIMPEKEVVGLKSKLKREF